jgi:hypothetical protein
MDEIICINDEVTGRQLYVCKSTIWKTKGRNPLNKEEIIDVEIAKNFPDKNKALLSARGINI